MMMMMMMMMTMMMMMAQNSDRISFVAVETVAAETNLPVTPDKKKDPRDAS